MPISTALLSCLFCQFDVGLTVNRVLSIKHFPDLTPSKEDDSCFFSGSSCSALILCIMLQNANCVLTKFNFVNNTDSVDASSFGH